MEDLIRLSSFYIAWTFSLYNIYSWLGITILRILMEPIIHKNAYLPLKVNVKYLSSHKTCYNVVHVFNYIQIFAAVITSNYEPILTDIVSKEGAPHNINIITSICADKYTICSAVTHTKLGMFLVMLLINTFFKCFCVYFSSHIVTNKWFIDLGILYNG